MPAPADFAPRRFRFIVFDWVGTLADSTALIADSLQRACRDVGEPVPDDADARYVIGLGLRDAVRHVAPGLAPARHPELAARYRHHYLTRDLDIALFAGAAELLDELAAAGFLLGVATGKTRAGLERALAQHAMGGRFAATRCADESRPKPHPQMLQQLMESVGVPAEATLMIGDTTHDLELARNAGTAALAAAYGAHPPARLERLVPLATVHSITELRTWLRTNA